MWEFHAAGGAPHFSWSWACYGGRPFSTRRSSTAFRSYHEVIADATRHGFNIVTDRWRIITPSDGIPLYESAPRKPLRSPMGHAPSPAITARVRPALPTERVKPGRSFEKQL